MTLLNIDFSKLSSTSVILGIVASILLIIFLFSDHGTPIFNKAAQMSPLILPLWFTLFFYRNFKVKLYPSFILACFVFSSLVLIYLNQNFYPIYAFGITIVLIIIFYLKWGRQIFLRRPWFRTDS